MTTTTTIVPAPVPAFIGGTLAIPPTVVDAVYNAPRGEYQRDLIRGREAWSGATLTGRAREYGARYADSRARLVARIRAALPAGWSACTDLVKIGAPARWHRELVLTAPTGERYVW